MKPISNSTVLKTILNLLDQVHSETSTRTPKQNRSMDSNASHNPQYGDLSKEWLRHLQGVRKTTVALPCDLCIDKKVWPSKDDLVAHALEKHSDKVRRNEHGDIDLTTGALELHNTRSRPSLPARQHRRPLSPVRKYRRPSSSVRPAYSELSSLGGSLNGELQSGNPTVQQNAPPHELPKLVRQPEARLITDEIIL
jgi:hypothetical protein